MTGEDDDDEPELDEVGEWSQLKLEMLQEYTKAYTRVVANQPQNFYRLYIDAFAGAGRHKLKATGVEIPGSPQIALSIEPPFNEYHFIEIDHARAQALRRLGVDRPDVFVHEGDCNEVLLKEVFPRARYSQFRRALILIDPYKMNLKWEVIVAAGSDEGREILLNFPIMDVNRNALRRDQSIVRPKDAGRMTALWGDESWREVAFVKEQGLFGLVEEKKPGNVAIVEAFRKRLQEVAGFTHVPEARAMRHPKGAVIYFLFFASHNATGAKIARSIFNKHRP